MFDWGALGFSRFQYFLEATTQFRDSPLQCGHTAYNAFVVAGPTPSFQPRKAHKSNHAQNRSNQEKENH